MKNGTAIDYSVSNTYFVISKDICLFSARIAKIIKGSIADVGNKRLNVIEKQKKNDRLIDVTLS
jgi:hypothetical protein